MRTPGPGDLRDMVAIRARVDVPNATYGSDVTYGDPVLVWGQITNVGGALFYGTQQIETGVTHRIVIRTGPTITEAHEVRALNKRFRIRRITDLGRAREYTLLDVEELEAAS